MSVSIQAESTPFFFIETSPNNQIIKMNEQLLQEIKMSDGDKQIENVFDVWQSKPEGNL